MIRTERWKLIRYPRIGREQLFDVATDPDERHDLSEHFDHQAMRRELCERVTTWLNDHGDPLK